ncbi:hypothetical protein GCM10028801_44570 [Nocardioides maradonensis]
MSDTRPNKRSSPGNEGLWLWLGVLGLLVVLVGGWMLAWLAASVAGHGAGGPGRWLLQPGPKGRWSLAASGWLVVFAVPLVGIVWWIGRSIYKAMTGREWTDRLASSMSSRRDLEELRAASVAADTERLGSEKAGIGVALCKSVLTGEWLYSTYEWCQVWIMGPRAGKALRSDAPVLTPHGWVPIKDLRPGQRVIGVDGQPTPVTGVFPQGMCKAYRVTLNDRTEVICNPEHLWTVRGKHRADRAVYDRWETLTTAEILERGLKTSDGRARFYLPLVAPVEFEGVLPLGTPYPTERPAPTERTMRPDATELAWQRRARLEQRRPLLPIEPYFLGVLLGDGCFQKHSVGLSTAEPDDLLPMLPLPPPLRWVPNTTKEDGTRGYDFRASSVQGLGGRRRHALLEAVKQLGLHMHRSEEKFVPQDYLLAPPAVRAAVLAGLLDTDGWIDHGGVQFSTSSPHLSEDVRFLVQSLGGTVTTSRRETTHLPAYRSHIRLPGQLGCPFRLPRKVGRWAEWRAARRSETPVRSIVAIEPAEPTDMTCISVANLDGLFVTEDFVVTHNTRSVAVPQIVEHKGAVAATSNKRDIVYMTMGPRSELGGCWVFDPQNIFRHGARFWWNPLSYVTDLERAEKLATIWRDSRTGGDLGAEDPFFGPESLALLTALVMAAAVGEQPVTAIAKWLKFPEGGPGVDTDPAEILRAHGYDATADDIDSTRSMVPETRDGIYGGARSAVRWMRNPKFTKWITPPEEGEDLPEFSTYDFVRSTQTIYMLSKDGPGSSRALVGALTIALHAAGMDLAEEVGDRVPTPILFMLDECANIVRWGELPSLFSYSGSLGLILVVILQSRAQGFKCWGKDGFTEMWSAANIACAGRGLRDEEHLAGLAQLIGDRQRLDHSRSVGPGHSSTSSQLKDERIFAESDLAAFPRGRVIVMPAGGRSILGELVDCSKRVDAPRIEASTAAFKQAWMEAEDEMVNAEREDVAEVI